MTEFGLSRFRVKILRFFLTQGNVCRKLINFLLSDYSNFWLIQRALEWQYFDINSISIAALELSQGLFICQNNETPMGTSGACALWEE